MKLDRELQYALLKALAEVYPNMLFRIEEAVDADEADVVANMSYLAEHGLVSAKFASYSGRSMQLNGSTRITAKGLDFLEQDGGLGAMLGLVTIKFHEETLRDLIEGGVLQSTLPQDEKTGVLKTLRELPADSIKHLTMKLLDLGLENSPKAVPLIQNWLSHLA